MDIEGLIEKSLGVFGRWQAMLVVLIFLSKFSVAWHTLLQIPQHHKPDGIACVNSEIDKCSPNCPRIIYNDTFFENTVIMEWDLVCDKNWVADTIQAICMLGILVGNIVLGWAADIFGRKKMLILGIIIQVVTGVAAGFVPQLAAFVVLRFLSLFATGGLMLTTFIVLVEYIAKKHRTVLCTIFQVPAYIGHALIGPTAWLLPRYDYLQIVFSAFNIILLSYICLLPESARWLLAKQRPEQVIKILENAAKCNRLPTEQIRGDVEQFMEDQKNVKQTPPGRLSDLFRTKRMRIKTILLCLNWFLISNLYYGVAQMTGSIAGNVFLNLIIGGCVQVPGNILCVFLCDWIGRKWSLIVAYIVAGIPMLLLMVIPSSATWGIVAMACLALVGNAMCFTIIYVYSGEMLPTVVRGVGMGIMSTIGRVGSTLSPYIMYIQIFGWYIPHLVFGIEPIIGCALTLVFLPETRGTVLPSTIEEADQL